MKNNAELLHYIQEMLVNIAINISKGTYKTETANEIVDNILFCKKIASSPLSIMIMGEFSTGKSTFINAIIGKEIAQINSTPTTAVITKLTYGKKENIFVYFKNGERERLDPILYKRYTDENQSVNFDRSKIDHIEYTMPIPLLREINIIDSPGLNVQKNEHIEATEKFVHQADIVVWMVNYQTMLKASEVERIKKLPNRLKPLILVNKIDRIKISSIIDDDDDDEDDENSETGLNDDIDGARQNMKGMIIGILPISAKLAYEGKVEQNPTKIQESRIKDFYDFLQEKILPVKENFKATTLLTAIASVSMEMSSLKNNTEIDTFVFNNNTDFIKDYLSLSYELDPILNYIEAYLKQDITNQTSEKYLFLGMQLLKESQDEYCHDAVYLLEKSANKGNILAKIIVSFIYIKKGDYKKARYWGQGIKKEDIIYSSRNDEDLNEKWGILLYSIGKSYILEYIETKNIDIKVAISLLRESGENGIIYSYNEIGDIYKNGIGLARDYFKACFYYKIAADKNDPTAEDNYGIMFYGGLGVNQNYFKAVEWYQKAAAQGNASAQNHLGVCYYAGRGVEQDYKKAAEWYRKAAEQGHDWAQNNLGECYYDGRGVEQDYKKAIEWYRKAAVQGNFSAQNHLGVCYGGGIGVEQDDSKAVVWYQKAASQEYDWAQYNLGECYYAGEGIKQDYKKAVEWYRKAAIQGNLSAQNRLGDCYYNGKGIEQDFYKAVEWYQKAAEQGDDRAQYNLANCYYSGEGIKQDYKKAVKWYRKAAIQGNTSAQNCLGNCYYNGKGVEKDFYKAVEWYQKAAKKGHMWAQNSLGECYYAGEGIKQDYKKAVEWYQKAAAQGNALSQNYLGVCYGDGIGVEQDYRKAVEWYQKAAEQGYDWAQYNLANCYYSGAGVEKNYQKAIEWYQKAAEQGNDTAKNKLMQINNEQKMNNEKNSGCFITTAVCESFMRPDDCYELTQFRYFRDHWLAKQSDGPALIREYYSVAPKIVDKLNTLKEASSIYQWIWDHYLSKCLTMIEKNEYASCKSLYIEMVNTLKEKYLKS